MALVTRSKFAKSLGISEKQVRNALEAGRLILEPHGKKGAIDDERLESRLFAKEMKLSDRAGKPVASRLTSGPKPEKLQPEPTPRQVEAYDLKYRKELAITREKELKNERFRGKLVDREDVARVFNEVWSIHQSEFIPIANKVAPEIASMFGVEDPEKIAAARNRLDSDLWKVLGSIKRALQAYLTEEE
jgi:hypothetical protein